MGLGLILSQKAGTLKCPSIVKGNKQSNKQTNKQTNICFTKLLKG